MHSTNKSLLDDQLIDMKFIVKYTGMSDKWFYKLIALKRFPKGIKLGGSRRWFKSEVEAWILKRIEESL
ncbi:helix-turn-helix transcriptional regulator [Serratia fonticola]|uniref:helix-turn-helix transcriptional regulator n=1 Tax=Serratia fonticola TaxID=47917 RepID=UPI003AAAD440